MRAIACDNGELTVADVPTPIPADDEILIRVAAAGVNRADLLQRRGLYPPPPGASDILGLEVSGTIAQVGAAVTGFDVGDEVCALLCSPAAAMRNSSPFPPCKCSPYPSEST